MNNKLFSNIKDDKRDKICYTGNNSKQSRARFKFSNLLLDIYDLQFFDIYD